MRTTIASLLLASVFLATGCAPAPTPADPPVLEEPASAEPSMEAVSAPAAYQKILAGDAKEMMEEDGVIVLDVRTKEEFDSGHIEGALLLPLDTIAERADELLPEKSVKLLVYCRSGNRSRSASEQLIEMGYTQVFDFGGIIDWPYDVVK